MAVFFLLCILVVISGVYLPFVLGGVCLVTALITATLVIIARKMIETRPKFLSQTLIELRRDVEGLKLDKMEASPRTQPGDRS